ncbi:putative toxin-antitoxin system toxin component, PIN family [Larkinella humicola]|uniref:Putative toxin-antitoxin system toxin component, PIN family n=1 Tax=Larkinella humicola TaxID=2607654 RepID=A0A5N1JGE3_9BACT|nr:putative toxin-antitoxin system toxin component, PIN family [Larkinella humicola]KAA9354789.1 putative toxin-antitoxin system toxin component, PIN family [Larkinella humicola]
MQKLVIDTNVLVSALISRSYPARIVEDILIERKATLILSEAIWEEYVDVLNRAKFARFSEFKKNAEILLLRLDELAEKVVPTETVMLIKDVDDNKFLEAALAAQAHYLVTGNSNDFTFSKIRLTQIVSPKEYWEQFISGL